MEMNPLVITAGCCPRAEPCVTLPVTEHSAFGESSGIWNILLVLMALSGMIRIDTAYGGNRSFS